MNCLNRLNSNTYTPVCRSKTPRLFGSKMKSTTFRCPQPQWQRVPGVYLPTVPSHRRCMQSSVFGLTAQEYPSFLKKKPKSGSLVKLSRQPFIHSMLIHALSKSPLLQDRRRSDVTRVNSPGTTCLVVVDSAFTLALRAFEIATQSSLLWGVRSVRTDDACLAVGTMVCFSSVVPQKMPMQSRTMRKP